MSKFEKGKSGNPRGRPPGSSNKVPAILKEAIIKAAELAGGEEGLTGYLQTQANANPSAFLSLLGKVLPLQMAGVDGVRQLVEVKLSVVQSEQQTSKQWVLDAKPLEMSTQPQRLGSTWETPTVTRLKLGDAK